VVTVDIGGGCGGDGGGGGRRGGVVAVVESDGVRCDTTPKIKRVNRNERAWGND